MKVYVQKIGYREETMFYGMLQPGNGWYATNGKMAGSTIAWKERLAMEKASRHSSASSKAAEMELILVKADIAMLCNEHD